MRRYVPLAMAALGLLAALSYYALGRSRGLPFLLNLDDGYIHARLAENLASTGQLGLNPGEGGGGGSSPLWTGISTLASLAGIPADRAVWIPSLLSWAAAVGFAAALAGELFSPAASLLVSLVVALNGQQIALALSGMESNAFLMAVFAVLFALKRKRLRSLLIWTGVLVLLRPEGILLPLSVLVSATVRPGDIGFSRKRLSWYFIGAVLVTLLGLAALSLVSGGFPSMLAGRRWLIDLPRYPWENVGLSLQAVERFMQQIGVRLTRFIGMGHGFGIIWGVILVLLMVMGALHWWRQGAVKRAIVIYMVLHLAFYSLLLPEAGQMGRYLVPIWGLSPFLVVSGWGALKSCVLGRRLQPVLPYLAAVLILGYLPQVIRWANWHRQTVSHLAKVHLRMAEWIRDMDLPQDEKIAAFDIGLLSFKGGQPLLDLGGLTDRRMITALYDRTVPLLLDREKIEYVVLPEVDGPQRYIFARKLGLPTVDLREVQRFSLGKGPKTYLQATLVAFPALTLYRWEGSGGLNE